jgi:hypothetical protein
MSYPMSSEGRKTYFYQNNAFECFQFLTFNQAIASPVSVKT